MALALTEARLRSLHPDDARNRREPESRSSASVINTSTRFMDSETASDPHPSFCDPVKGLSRYKFFVASKMRLLYDIGEEGWVVLKRDTLTLCNWFDPAMRDKSPLPDDIESGRISYGILKNIRAESG